MARMSFSRWTLARVLLAGGLVLCLLLLMSRHGRNVVKPTPGQAFSSRTSEDHNRASASSHPRSTLQPTSFDQIQADLNKLKKLIASGASPDEWLKVLAAIHADALRCEEHDRIISGLAAMLRDDSNSAAFRSVAALLLGCFSEQTRIRLATELDSLEPEVGIAAVHALALSSISPGSSVQKLQSFWLGAVLHLAGFGVVAPGYVQLYINREMGLPPDTPGWWGEPIEIPTHEFVKHLRRIDEPTSKSSVLKWVGRYPREKTLLVAHQLLPSGDVDTIALSKQLYVRDDVRDPDIKLMLIALISQGSNPIPDLVWVYSHEKDKTLRAEILARIHDQGSDTMVLQMIFKELGSIEQGQDIPERLLELLSKIPDSGAARLWQIFAESKSDAIKIGVIRSIEGNVTDTPKLTERIELFRRVLTDRSPAVRMRAVKALRWLPKDSRDLLLREHLPNEQDEGIRAEILQQLRD